MQCRQCSQPITQGAYAQLPSGHFIHQSCFKCSHCQLPLSPEYILEDNLYYHPKCFDEKNQKSCFLCHEPILPSKHQQTILIEQKHLIHQECFKCSHCHQSLVQQPFRLKDNQLYHMHCSNELFSPKCQKCQKAIGMDQQFIKVEDFNFHSECFQCSFCKRKLDTQKFFKSSVVQYGMKDSDFCCGECFEKEMEMKRQKFPSVEKLIQSPTPEPRSPSLKKLDSSPKPVNRNIVPVETKPVNRTVAPSEQKQEQKSFVKPPPLVPSKPEIFKKPVEQKPFEPTKQEIKPEELKPKPVFSNQENIKKPEETEKVKQNLFASSNTTQELLNRLKNISIENNNNNTLDIKGVNRFANLPPSTRVPIQMEKPKVLNITKVSPKSTLKQSNESLKKSEPVVENAEKKKLNLNFEVETKKKIADESVKPQKLSELKTEDVKQAKNELSSTNVKPKEKEIMPLAAPNITTTSAAPPPPPPPPPPVAVPNVEMKTEDLGKEKTSISKLPPKKSLSSELLQQIRSTSIENLNKVNNEEKRDASTPGFLRSESQNSLNTSTNRSKSNSLSFMSELQKKQESISDTLKRSLTLKRSALEINDGDNHEEAKVDDEWY